MKLSALTAYLESFAPLVYQEDYDNAGLIVGNPDQEVSQALISLDCTEAVVDEAINKDCQVIVSHHPIVFKGLKRLNGKSYVERVVEKAIRHNIAIYAIHTNLDNIQPGVSGMMAAQLGLINCQVLQPKQGLLKKLFVFVPTLQAAQVRNAIFNAGAGHIGNYSECSFNTAGSGTFTAGKGSRPFVGVLNQQHTEEEIKIETIFPAWLEDAIINAIKVAHPYEEVAYDILPLSNRHEHIGAGIVGELPTAMDETEFLQQVKAVFQVPVVRHTPLTGKQVKRVALCGGAGSFLISNAIRAAADVYITADVKYHEFFDANGRLVIADVGHYESEQFTIPLIAGFLREKFPTFAALKTGVKTNPVNYFL